MMLCKNWRFYPKTLEWYPNPCFGGLPGVPSQFHWKKDSAFNLWFVWCHVIWFLCGGRGGRSSHISQTCDLLFPPAAAYIRHQYVVYLTGSSSRKNSLTHSMMVNYNLVAWLVVVFTCWRPPKTTNQTRQLAFISIPFSTCQGKNPKQYHIPHTIHVWYIYLHLVDLYGKCR